MLLLTASGLWASSVPTVRQDERNAWELRSPLADPASDDPGRATLLPSRLADHARSYNNLPKQKLSQRRCHDDCTFRKHASSFHNIHGHAGLRRERRSEASVGPAFVPHLVLVHVNFGRARACVQNCNLNLAHDSASGFDHNATSWIGTAVTCNHQLYHRPGQTCRLDVEEVRLLAADLQLREEEGGAGFRLLGFGSAGRLAQAALRRQEEAALPRAVRLPPAAGSLQVLLARPCEGAHRVLEVGATMRVQVPTRCWVEP